MTEIDTDIIHCHFINSHLKMFIPLFAKLLGIKRSYYTVHSCMDWDGLKKINIFINMFDKKFLVSKHIKNNMIESGVESKNRIELSRFGKGNH